MKPLAVLCALVLISSGCTSIAPVRCEEPDFDPPGRLTCETVASAARERLAAVPDVVDLEVLWLPCPDNGRCAWRNGDVATVFATTRDDPGNMIRIHVSVGADGVVRAELPRPIMPPEAPAGG